MSRSEKEDISANAGVRHKLMSEIGSFSVQILLITAYLLSIECTAFFALLFRYIISSIESVQLCFNLFIASFLVEFDF